MWIALAVTGQALAAPLAAELHADGLTFAAGEIAGMEPLAIGPFDVQASYDCYDVIDVDNVNLTVPIQDLQLTTGPDGLSVDLTLGTVTGEYWEVFTDSGWLDLCFDVDVIVELIELSDGHLTGTLSGEVVDGALQLQWTEAPVLTGDLRTDTDWVPDSLIWLFVQGVVLDSIATTLSDTLPPAVEAFTSEGLFSDHIGGVPVTAELTDVTIATPGVYLAVDVGVGESSTAPTDPPISETDLGPRDGSHLAVAVGDQLIQDVLGAAWAEGLLDPASQLNQELLAELTALLGVGDTLTVAAGIAGQPDVSITADALSIALQGVSLDVSTPAETLVHAVVDVSADLEVTVDPGQTELGLSIHEVELEVLELDLADVISPETADALLAELETMVAEISTEAVAGVPIYTSEFGILGYVLEVQEIDFVDGALLVWARLHPGTGDDVDLTPPETDVVAARTDDGAIVTFSGTDDRAGLLAYSWRVDGGGWSAWTEQTTVTLTLAPGDHVVEARARDGWLNVDDTPATASFTLLAPEVASAPEREDEAETGGCGCATGAWSATSMLQLASALFARR